MRPATIINRQHLPCAWDGCDGEFRISEFHVERPSVYRWSCSECARYTGLRWDGVSWQTGREGSPARGWRYALLRVEGPFHVIVDTYKNDEPEDVAEDNARYYYGEHTCPVNWMRDAAEVIAVGHGGNLRSDPHHLAEFVGFLSAPHGEAGRAVDEAIARIKGEA
jgi:hypothetical protein